MSLEALGFVDEVVTDDDEEATNQTSADGWDMEMRADIERERQKREQNKEKLSERIKFLWNKIREKYKPKRTNNSFYVLYKTVMQHRMKCYDEYNALGIPPPKVKETPEEEDAEKTIEIKPRKARLRRAVRLSLVNRQQQYAWVRPAPAIDPKNWTPTVRQIQGEELAFCLMTWLHNVQLDLYSLAAKICVVDKSEDDLIKELSLVILTALFSREWNAVAWPKYTNWTLTLKPDGTALQPDLYWISLRVYKFDLLTDIKDPELHRLIYCRKPSQRQLLFRQMYLFFCERLRSMSNGAPPHPSNLNKYISIPHLFDLDNPDRFWKFSPNKEEEEAEWAALRLKKEEEELAALKLKERLLHKLQHQTLAEQTEKSLNELSVLNLTLPLKDSDIPLPHAHSTPTKAKTPNSFDQISSHPMLYSKPSSPKSQSKQTLSNPFRTASPVLPKISSHQEQLEPVGNDDSPNGYVVSDTVAQHEPSFQQVSTEQMQLPLSTLKVSIPRMRDVSLVQRSHSAPSNEFPSSTTPTKSGISSKSHQRIGTPSTPIPIPVPTPVHITSTLRTSGSPSISTSRGCTPSASKDLGNSPVQSPTSRSKCAELSRLPSRSSNVSTTQFCNVHQVSRSHSTPSAEFLTSPTTPGSGISSTSRHKFGTPSPIHKYGSPVFFTGQEFTPSASKSQSDRPVQSPTSKSTCTELSRFGRCASQGIPSNELTFLRSEKPLTDISSPHANDFILVDKLRVHINLSSSVPSSPNNAAAENSGRFGKIQQRLFELQGVPRSMSMVSKSQHSNVGLSGRPRTVEAVHNDSDILGNFISLKGLAVQAFRKDHFDMDRRRTANPSAGVRTFMKQIQSVPKLPSLGVSV